MFAGTRALVKLILRRDRIKLPIWVIGIVVTLLSMIPILKDTYGDAASLNALYQSFASNAAGLFMTGPIDGPIFGAMVTVETLLWWGMAVAFMNTLFVVRHTRQNEEMGAQELLLSGQAHRGAGLFAALTVAFWANIALAVGIGGGLVTMEPSWGAGAWLYGLTLGMFGFMWAVIAAIVVQFTENTRSANGILASLIGISFAVRGVGDFMAKPGTDGLMYPAWFSWLSPFGWMQATRALTFPEWWPLIVPVIFAIVVIPIAFLLLNKRDVGAGLLPARKGRARASTFLKNPWGLTWRLQKNIFIGWLAASLITAITVGAMVPEMSNVYKSSGNLKEMIDMLGGTGAMVPAFLSAMLMIIAVMVVAYVVQGLGKLNAEESSGHVENLLAAKCSRLQWLGMHAATVSVGGAVMLAATGAVLAVTVNLVTDITVDTWSYTAAGLSYFPLLFLFIALYVVLFGVIPRIAGAVSWVVFGFVAFMSWLGPLLKLDEWVMELSPLSHIAASPAEDIALAPLLVMASIALVFVVVGTLAFRRRDIQTS